MNDVPEVTDSRNDDAEALLKLAVARFGKLTPAEEKLFRNTAMGEPADFSWCISNEPVDAEDWNEPCVLRADRIAWLCADRKAREYITHRGLVIQGVRIEGILDLSSIQFPYPCELLNCSIAGGVILFDSAFLLLSLSGSYTGPIYADGMKVAGSVFLRNGFRAEGEVRLLGATLVGNLDCEDGTFINRVGDALSADRMKVEGGVILVGGFRAEGEVRLLGAIIGGNLECVNGTFINPEGNALNADGVNVEGSVNLRDGFRAEGEVRLIGASIGGDLDCNDGTFINPITRTDSDRHSLCANRMKVEGNVFLNKGFKAVGEVSLIGGIIGGDLKCDDGTFINPTTTTDPDRYALSANRMKIEGHVFLGDKFKAEGKLSFASTFVRGEFQLRNVDAKSCFELDLRSSSFGGFWDDPEKWPKKENLTKLQLQGLVYDDFVKGLPSDAESRIEWLELQDDDEYFPQPYEQLAAVLKKNGQVVDARDVLIAKEKSRKGKGKLSWSERWLWYKTLGRMIGYGYRPLWAFLYALIFIAVGAGLFWVGQELLAPTGGKPTAAESGEDSSPYPTFNAFMYSLDTFIPIVDFHQVKYRLPNAQMVPEADKKVWQVRSGSLLLAWFWIEVGAGWVITSVLIVGLTGFVRS